MVPSGTRVLTLLLPPISAANALGTTWGRLDEPLVAALAVEAQGAGHLTGNEEMEGAIPFDGSPLFLAAMIQE